jgi:AcrR family transcriptional regulator
MSPGAQSTIQDRYREQTGHLRREPTQVRSKEYVERVLAAAEELLLEIGFDRLTTNHIADRIGGSVGGIYRFFPDKYAICNTLTERQIERMVEIERRFLAPEYSPQEWRTWVPRLIDDLSRCYRENRAFRVLWTGLRSTEHGASVEDAARRRFVPTTRALVRRVLPSLSPDREDVVVAMVSDLVIMLNERATGLPEEADSFYENLLEESKALFCLYVEHCLAEEAHRNE